MGAPWPMVKLGEALRKSENWITLRPDETYKQITVKLWGKGVVLRGIVAGAEIAASQQLQVKADQFILSRIDARNGALGLVPSELDGGVVSNDFPVFDVAPGKMLSPYMGWLCKTRDFVDQCRHASEGTTNRVRLKEDRFLEIPIPLPPLAEQRRIVARIGALAAKIDEARGLHQAVNDELDRMLGAAFQRIIRDAPRRRMSEAAPLVRRAIAVEWDKEYPELGIRSFGKGTFHKPPVKGAELGGKRIFDIEPGDLVFNNVFAWEGAVAVAQKEDAQRAGSHRFITCVPKKGVATPEFLWFYFKTREGIERLGEASPGGAGRNRTLGLSSLGRIEVPIPKITEQLRFDALQAQVDALKQAQAASSAELDALLPSVLDRAFKGEG